MNEWKDDDEVVTTFGSLKQGMREAGEDERAGIIAHLENYYRLTRFSVEIEGAEENTEWNAGFCAAVALIKELGT
jgi:hypothetical protein